MIGKQKTNEYILPVFLNFIKDESHELRIAALNTVDKLNDVCYIMQ